MGGVQIRGERTGDRRSIRQLLCSAFPTDAEAKLVEALRASRMLTLSLVALHNEDLVGYIAFSPVVLWSGTRPRSGIGLAPLAVAPAHQQQGIGGDLVRSGLHLLASTKQPFCVVLGHSTYYPRHGFVKAATLNIRWEKPGSEDVFFVRELVPGALDGSSGVVRYSSEFDSL
ncbi:MAG: N-acetyltransferase [Polyangiaceae bacterium]